MKVVLVGLNYRSHAKELGMQVPEVPIIFLKPETSVIGPGDAIRIPKGVGRVDYEGEIGVLIKENCKDVPPEGVLSIIEGLVALNDVTARDIQKKDDQWTRAKGFDTFCPISSEILPIQSWDEEIFVKTYLNRKQVQCGVSSDMIFPIPYLVSFVSSVMSLRKGDVISTGTPVGVGPIFRGDEVKVVVNVGLHSVEVANPVV